MQTHNGRFRSVGFRLAPTVAIATLFVLSASGLPAYAATPSVSWTKQTTSYSMKSTGNYNSFVVDGSNVTIFNNIGNGADGKLYRGVGSLSSVSAWSAVINKGPETDLQWLRAPAVARGSSNA